MSKVVRSPGRPAVTRVETIEVEPAVPATVTITMTQEQANRLAALLANYGGGGEDLIGVSSNELDPDWYDRGIHRKFIGHVLGPHSKTHKGKLNYIILFD